MTKVYLSAAIKGANPDPELVYKVVKHLQSLGYEVLSEHVGALTHEDRDMSFFVNTGEDIRNLPRVERAVILRKYDMHWVDEAEMLIVILKGPSTGVGQEIERAVTKPQRGLPTTPIIFFIQKDHQEDLTNMVIGIRPDEAPTRTYMFETFEDIKAKIGYPSSGSYL